MVNFIADHYTISSKGSVISRNSEYSLELNLNNISNICSIPLKNILD